MVLKSKQKWDMQVQGQLALTGLREGFLVICTETDTLIRQIHFNCNQWDSVIYPKLHEFYFEHCLSFIQL